MNKNNYQVLARKYRPQRFADVVGQKAVVTTLKNALRMNRVAHAYLFCGSRGTGKTTLARLFAKALNCMNPSMEEGEPCNNCSSCKEIAQGQAIDLLEIDGASHRGIEDMRHINETVGFIPSRGKYKIYLIDEVHMLTKEAFNALLKTVEEPPLHAKFFFATTEPHKIPETILSRCQRFNLGRISTDEIQTKLASIASELSLSIELDALQAIAERSEGSLRDAESLFDQLIAFKDDKISLETVQDLFGLPSIELFFYLDEAGAKKNFLAPFEITQKLLSSGKNLSYFLEELISHFRRLFLLKQNATTPSKDKEKYAQSATLYRQEQLLGILEMLVESQQTIKSAPSERTALEIILLKILRSHQKLSIDTLVNRLEDLEKRLSVSEDPHPKPEELPTPPKNSPESRARTDTMLQFAAKEFKGNWKKTN